MTTIPKNKNFLQQLKGFILGMIVVLGVTAIAWNGPVSAPPNYNAYAPINISAASQTKDGALWAGSFLTTGGGYFGGDLQIVGECIGCIPSGAVLAFNLSSCPFGWNEYTTARGRTIIGTNPDTSNGLSARALNVTVGEERHTLIVSEMPSHTHNVIGNPAGGSGQGSWQAVTPSQPFAELGPTSSVGGSQPHNVMQPSIALLYCQKN